MELQLIQAGIPKQEINDMSESEVIRKWVVIIEMMERSQNEMKSKRIR